MGCHIPLESSRPLFFSTKGAPILCLGALRPYWGIYGICCFTDRQVPSWSRLFRPTLQEAFFLEPVYEATPNCTCGNVAANK